MRTVFIRKNAEQAMSTVDKPTLLRATGQHIREVQMLLDQVRIKLDVAGKRHDSDKVSDINAFHKDFVSGFETTVWWDRHRTNTRHHLNSSDGVPPDVNLMDILEQLADGISAGLGRTGSYTPAQMDPDVLMRAFKNTEDFLVDLCEITQEEPSTEGA